MELLYKLSNVSCSFNGNAPVLSIDALNIPRGKIIAVLGESGSGKSTLLNVLGRLYPSDEVEDVEALFYPSSEEGEALDLTEESPGEHCSFIFQNSYLFESASIELNLNLMDVTALSDAETATFLDKFGMPTNAGRISSRVRDLSGGQKRRLALISSLLRDRDTILADELTSDLDPIWADKSLKILKSWQRENEKRTIIWVTHNYEQALEYADVVLFLTPEGKVHELCYNRNEVATPIDWPTRDVEQLKLIVSNNATDSVQIDQIQNTNKTSFFAENSIKAISPESPTRKNIGSLPLAASLALMTSFEPGRDWLEKLRKIKIFTHVTILSIILTLATLAFGVWSFVGADVERQKQDPQTQHFVVVQNMRAANTRLRQQDLDQLNTSLFELTASDPPSPFQDCLADNSAEKSPKVFGRLDQIESVLLYDNQADRSITRRARLLLLDPTDPLLACMRVLSVNDRTEVTETLGTVMKYSDELKIVLSQQFYDQVVLEGSEGIPTELQFARGYDAKGPAFEIAGLMPVAPYNERFAIDGVSTTDIFKTWRSITGENSLKDFDSASVYFTEETAKDTISEMKKRNYIFNVEAYNKFSSIVELRNVIEDGFKIFALIVVFSILSTIGFLAWLFLSKFSQPIGILAAHKRPTRIVLYTFLIQIIISLGASIVISGIILMGLKHLVPALGNIISTTLFALAFIIVSISAIMGSIGSFVLWRRTNHYPMQMLRR